MSKTEKRRIIETLTNNNKSKGDDIMNSKYISYYKSLNKNNEINKIRICNYQN